MRLGAEVVEGEVLGIAYEAEGFSVSTAAESYAAPAVILATGSSRKVPHIAGLLEFEGKGVSYCAVCDAFFYKGKDVAVLGDGEYALHEAAELLPIVSSVTLVTNGKRAPENVPENMRVVTAKVEALEGESTLSALRLEDGGTIAVSGLFVALGVAGSSDLARKLGAEVDGTSVVVDREMKTGVPGLFAAGDCTGGMYQVAKAVYEGAVAGTSAVKYTRGRK
ncbi:MAG: NAD(P)/FAD-dependent oxidoreductase, partial [Acetanaerobacterium sp.]